VETEEVLEEGQLPPPAAPLAAFAPGGGGGLREWRASDEHHFKTDLKAATAEEERPLTEAVDQVRFGEVGWKDRYYEHKLHIAIGDNARRRQVGLEYVRGLCWVLKYYYQGVPSWTWFYPYHYAPCASDLIDLPATDDTRTFELGAPFPPLEQLLAVLPPLSAKALPRPIRAVFDSQDEAVAKFFPRKVEYDLNGAREVYKAVVLLPFIDAPTLRAACVAPLEACSSEERARNRFGPNYIYLPTADRLAREVWQLADEHRHLDGYKMAQVVRPVQADSGLAALLTPYPSVPARGTRSSPCPALMAVTNNRVASAMLRLPPQRPHVSQLLPNTQLPPPCLGPYDYPVPNAEEESMSRSLYSSGGMDGYQQQVQMSAGGFSRPGRY